MLRRVGLMLCLLSIGVGAARAQSVANVNAPLRFDPTVCYEHVDGGDLSPACQSMIEAFPRPAVFNVPQDGYTLDTYSFWRVGPDPVPTYDSPGGVVVGEIGRGFNFVRAINLSVEGWLQIEGGSWIRRDSATYAQASFFTGVQITNGLEYPFAWVLDMSRIPVSTRPGGPWDASTGRFLQRYERVNIFSIAYDDAGWRWYMIGPNHWVEQRFVAKVQRIERPEGVSGRWVAIDLYEQTLVAYENDTPVFATLVSTGRPLTPTNEGLFNIWAALPRDRMASAAGAPSAYALQSVPWVMYFDNSISLHGTYWHDMFGYRHSRGCVNLSISDAKWLFDWFSSDPNNNGGAINNFVYVWSSGEYGRTASGI